MCFSPSMPNIKPQATAMPTQRDANIDGTRRRQQAAAGAQSADTIATSPLGVTTAAPTYKSTLG